jgi:hypothetical protein
MSSGSYSLMVINLFVMLPYHGPYFTFGIMRDGISRFLSMGDL